MSQVLLNLCDRHDPHERVEGEPFTITVNGEVIEIDLCADDAKPLQDLLTELREYGRTGKELAKRARTGEPRIVDAEGQLACPDCGAKFNSPQGLGMHRSRAHGVGSSDSERPWACSRCDKRYLTRNHLVDHISRVHQLSRTQARDETAVSE